jgi:hypothetical protein
MSEKVSPPFISSESNVIGEQGIHPTHSKQDGVLVQNDNHLCTGNDNPTQPQQNSRFYSDYDNQKNNQDS